MKRLVEWMKQLYCRHEQCFKTAQDSEKGGIYTCTYCCSEVTIELHKPVKDTPGSLYMAEQDVLLAYGYCQMRTQEGRTKYLKEYPERFQEIEDYYRQRITYWNEYSAKKT